MERIVVTVVLMALAAALLPVGGLAAEKEDNWGSGALCARCKEMGFTADIGKCGGCGGGTSSGSFMLCQACAQKAGKCQACGAALAAKPAGDKPADPPAGGGDADKKDDGKALAAVQEWLKAKDVKTEEAPGEIAAAAIKAALPNHRFFLLRFPMHPVARRTPEPLASVNIFAVAAPDKDGKREVTHLKSAEELVAFCEKELRARDRDAARSAAHAYCLLRMELAQDGFFKFEIKPEDFEVAEKDGAFSVKASIKTVPGGKNGGAIDVQLSFAAKEGTFKLVDEQARLKAGIRPICQSLRLNDPDPDVRAAAERDILIMGRNALPYLHEQIARTYGGLRQEIVALTRRIEAGEGGPSVPGGQPEAGLFAYEGR